MNIEDKQTQILEKIKNVESQISALTDLKEKLLSKLNTALSDLSLEIGYPPQVIPSSNSLTKSNKAKLFQSLFRGRDDVYARLWINNRTGKRGYSPVCKHEWDRVLCRKPAIKCSECPNQGFLSMDELAISQHLSGAQVMAVYPMLKSENCYFLAIDFDKEHWIEDVRAIMKTCAEEKIPAAVERSRSGNGGHVWVFFSEEISAVLARRLETTICFSNGESSRLAERDGYLI